jgi:hypothetical protein
LIAVGSLLAAAYTGVRWATVEAETTTDDHLASLEELYADAGPASLVVEFDDMEQRSLDLLAPYQYQVQVEEKARWGRNALIALGLAIACGIGGLVAGSRGRSRTPPPQDSAPAQG